MLEKYFLFAVSDFFLLESKFLYGNFADKKKNCTFAQEIRTAPRGGAVVARWAHNPKDGGSIPSPATSEESRMLSSFSFISVCIVPSGKKYFNLLLFFNDFSLYLPPQSSKNRLQAYQKSVLFISRLYDLTKFSSRFLLCLLIV